MIERLWYLFVLIAIAVCVGSCKSACAKDHPDVPSSEHAVFGKILTEIDPPEETMSAVISPDGTRIASSNAYGKNLYIWDAKSGNKIAKLTRDEGGMSSYSPVFTPDSRYVLFSSLEAGDNVPEHMDVAFSVIDALSGEKSRSVNGPKRNSPAASNNAYQIAISGDGSTAAVEKYNNIWIFDTASWSLKNNFENNIKEGSSVIGEGFSISLNKNGNIVAIGDTLGSIEVFNTETGSPKQLIHAHMGQISSLVFSGDGRRIFSAAQEAGLTDMSHMQAYLSGTDETNRSDDENVKSWDVSTGKLLQTYVFKGPLHSGTYGIALSPNEKTLVAVKVSRNDGSLLAFDVASGKMIDQRTTTPAPVRSISYTAYGRTLCMAASNIILTLNVNNKD